MADWFSPSDVEAPTLEYVVFEDRKTGRHLVHDAASQMNRVLAERSVDDRVVSVEADIFGPEQGKIACDNRFSHLDR